MSLILKNKIELFDVVRDYKSQNKTIGWTNGCFYLLHPGHVEYLEKAKQLCDVLIVGINGDDYIEKMKNKKRIFSVDERLFMISRLKPVDHVISFYELNTITYLEIVYPDLYIKGGDYTIDTINQDERKFVESYGGKIEIIKRIYETSSTNVVEKILCKNKENK